MSLTEFSRNKNNSKRKDLSSTTHLLSVQPTLAHLEHDVECTEKVIHDYSVMELSSTLCDENIQHAIKDNESKVDDDLLGDVPGSEFNPISNDKIAPRTSSEEVVAAQMFENEQVVECTSPKSTVVLSAKNNKKAKPNVAPFGDFNIKCKSGGRCTELFESPEAMMFHITTYHAKDIKRMFCCHMCKKILTRKAGIQRHIISVHIDQKNFKCPYPKCSKSFSVQQNLQRHINTVHLKKNVLN